jgi:tRNA threonylcarbamoyladenosine biosynthesis protein TsaB
MQQLLTEAALGFHQLDLLAVGRGPGGFTGVRLAISIAQGLSYSTGVPVVPVSTLRAVAQDARSRDVAAVERAGGRLLVCQDARMSEVYSGCFNVGDGVVAAGDGEQLSTPAEVRLPQHWRSATVFGCGSAFAAYPVLAAQLGTRLATGIARATASARAVAQLAAHDGLRAAVAAAELQPVYLRNNVAVAATSP